MLKPTLMAAVPVRSAHSGSAVSHRPWGGNSTFKQIMIFFLSGLCFVPSCVSTLCCVCLTYLSPVLDKALGSIFNTTTHNTRNILPRSKDYKSAGQTGATPWVPSPELQNRFTNTETDRQLMLLPAYTINTFMVNSFTNIDKFPMHSVLSLVIAF